MTSAWGLRFLENKGQLMDMQRKAVHNVLFKTGTGGVDLYVTTTGLSYVFTKMEKHKKANIAAIQNKFVRHSENDSLTIQYCRADMQLAGADIRKENIVKEDESTDRTDYYYGDICPDGILGVHSYGKVTIKNIYPGIDWVLHSGKQGLKYDFIVHPGADPSMIRLKYKWTDKPELQDDGSLKINTPMGNIKEGTPASYSNGKQVPTTYTIKDSEIHFNVGNYNSTQPLTIDPALVWATYLRGSSVEDVTGLQDDSINVWVGGGTLTADFPTVNPGGGAYFQGKLVGYQDVFILKFSMAGVLEWSTYYGGGSNATAGLSIYSDRTSVWLTGAVNSSNLPTYNPGGGAYFQAIPNGPSNAFILQFSTAGVRKWATYFGGNKEDIGYSIQSDGTHVWLTGTTSSTNFPTLNPGGGAYFQGTLASVTSSNAFISQFNTAGVLKWSTYYGGASTLSGDIGLSIYSDGSHAWVTGKTTSPNWYTLNPGGGAYYQPTIGERQNGFILKFTPAGVLKWSTYYGGTGNGLDAGYCIYSDGLHIWITGETSATNLYTLNPGGGAYFQGTLNGSSDAFILEVDTAGVPKWATYYGGSGMEYGYSIQSDGTNVWLCGLTGSTDFPVLNPGCGFFQDTVHYITYDDQNVFILQFNTAGVRKWATYYGSDWENDGSYISSDGTNLLVAGDAAYAGYPTVNPGGGAYYFDTTYIATGDETIFIGKFVTEDLHVLAPAGSICSGASTTLMASGATSYSWSPPTGLSATNIANPVANPTVTTTYTVIGNSGGCMDTNTVTVRINQSPIVNACCDTSIITGQSVHLSSTGSGSYSWAPSTGLSCDTCPDPTATPNQTTTYTLTITNDSGCSAQNMVTIDVECGTVFIPDVFSPNQAHNKILYVRGACITGILFEIFDRWGNKVFKSENLTNGWDGTYNGKPLNTGTYIWTLKASMKDGTSLEKKGNVTLVR